MPRGRPPLPVGTYGKITTTEERRKDGVLTYRARTLYRGSSGRTKRVVRFGATQGRAERALKVALASMQAETATDGITPNTTVSALAAAWMAEPHPWRPTTREQYVRIIAKQIDPRMGGVRLSEVRASTVSRLLVSLRDHEGPSAALLAKKAMSGMFRLAIINDAMPANPATGTVTIPRSKKEVRALTRDEEDALRDALRSDSPGGRRAVELDLPDLVEWMLATGCRIGEALAAQDRVVDLEVGTWEINATVVRVRGVGLMIQPRPKTEAGWRRIALPSYAVRMVQRRSNELRLQAPGGVIFGNPRNKRLRDPSNATGDLREVLNMLDLDWVTSHVFRKTVATRLDEAGLTARQIADHLGHAKPSMTMDVYMGRRVTNAEAARVLDR